MTYKDKLQLPQWQIKRLAILQRDNFKCASCHVHDKPLHVHHKYYIFEKDPWDYPDCALITLCAECHEAEGDFKITLQELIRDLLCNGFDYMQLHYYLTGLSNLTGMDKWERIRAANYVASNDDAALMILDKITAEHEEFLNGIADKTEPF